MNMIETIRSDKYKKCSDKALAKWKDVRRGKYISGNDIKTLTYMTVETCKVACLQQDSFHCRSIEFNRGANTCYLQSVVE
jgi:hypothetical protein